MRRNFRDWIGKTVWRPDGSESGTVVKVEDVWSFDLCVGVQYANTELTWIGWGFAGVDWILCPAWFRGGLHKKRERKTMSHHLRCSRINGKYAHHAEGCSDPGRILVAGEEIALVRRLESNLAALEAKNKNLTALVETLSADGRDIAGWYWACADYTEDGWVGGFSTREEAELNATGCVPLEEGEALEDVYSFIRVRIGGGGGGEGETDGND